MQLCVTGVSWYFISDILHTKLTNHFRNQKQREDCNISEVTAGVQRFNSLQNMKGKENYSWKKFWDIKIFNQRSVWVMPIIIEKHIEILIVPPRITLNARNMTFDKCMD